MKTKPINTVVHPCIQRDRHSRWHPQMEIRQAGQTIYMVTALQHFLNPYRAQQEAETEALRLTRMHNGGEHG